MGSYLLLSWPALFLLSRSNGFFRCGGDSCRTQLRDAADELHWNRFGELEMDGPLSQFIAPELILQSREERPRCCKQRIVFLKGREIQHWLSVQLVSGHAIPDGLHCFRNGVRNRGTHLFKLRPHSLRLRGDVFVNRRGNVLHRAHSVFRDGVFPRRYHWTHYRRSPSRNSFAALARGIVMR